MGGASRRAAESARWGSGLYFVCETVYRLRGVMITRRIGKGKCEKQRTLSGSDMGWVDRLELELAMKEYSLA